MGYKGTLRIGVLKLGGIGDMCDFAVILYGIRSIFPDDAIVAISDNGIDILTHYADAVLINKQAVWHDLSSKLGWQYDIFYDLRPHSGLVFSGDYWARTKRLIANNRDGHSNNYVSATVSSDDIRRFKYYNSVYTNKLQDLNKSVITLGNQSAGTHSTYDNARLNISNHLTDSNFITINISAMGANIGVEQTKQWDIDKWQVVVDELSRRGEKVIQLGIRWEQRLKRIKSVWNRPLVKVMRYLEASKLHLGVENGMVRLRRLLTNRPSIVLFGPTAPLMYGFENNINIHKNVCRPCFWCTGDWMTQCPLDLDCICMRAINPEDILQEYENICVNTESLL